MTTPKQIFLVDDHPMVREGLVNLLTGAGFIIAGEADGLRQTLDSPALPESDLVIVDLTLGDENGIELIMRLRLRGVAVLVYSMHESPHIIRQALDAGADGYVTKREAPESLTQAIHAVLRGVRFLSPRVSAALGAESPSELLTGQQQQIYRLMGTGLSNDAIARQLDISVRTFESYCARIMSKLGIQSIRELRRLAIQNAITKLPCPGNR